MFGGIGFMLNVNMVCGMHKNDLMLHVAAADTDALLKRPGAKPFVMRDRPMQGWVLVAPEAIATQKTLAEWIDVALVYAQTLPPKGAKTSSKKPAQAKAR